MDAALRKRFADKARSSIMSLEHDRVMDMMVSNYEGVIKDYARAPPPQADRNDLYITFIYHFFSFLLFLATPVLKAYVGVLGLTSRLCSAELWEACVRGVASGAVCNMVGLGSSVHSLCATMTFREKMRVLACCVYLFAIIIIFQTLASV
jgi:hypothetical protein